MDRRLKINKLTAALALCGTAMFSIHANAAYLFRVAVPGIKPEGLSAYASISTASLVFANQTVGTTSSPQSVSLTNTGNAPLSVGLISVAGNFADTSTCGASLAINASCLINVTFTPQALNANSGTLSLVTGAGTKTVSLSGTGQQAILSTAPASLAFGNVLAGSSSAAQSFTLSNTGNITATGLTVSTPSGYAETDNCGGALAAGSVCTGTVTFSPTTAGAANGKVSISSTNASATSVSVTGTGTSAVLSANALNFGTVNDYSTTTQSLTISNSGTGTASPTFSSSSSAFAVSGCTSIPAGGSCNATVTLNTTTAGSYSSTLTISGGTNGAVTTTLNATSQKVVTFFTTVGATTWAVPARVTQIAVLVVGGGGGPEAAGGTGNGLGGNGGGGGQVVYNPAYTVTPGASIAVTVGAGGDVGPDSTEDGTASVFATLSAAGGLSGYEGGASGAGYAGGTGCTPTLQGGGGGGAGGAGSSGTATNGGTGGPGIANSITGSVVYYGAGGGGAVNSSTGTPGAAGSGGTGIGGTLTVIGGVGAANSGSGSGGGGGGGRANAAAGVVIVAY